VQLCDKDDLIWIPVIKVTKYLVKLHKGSKTASINVEKSGFNLDFPVDQCPEPQSANVPVAESNTSHTKQEEANFLQQIRGESSNCTKVYPCHE